MIEFLRKTIKPTFSHLLTSLFLLFSLVYAIGVISVGKEAITALCASLISIALCLGIAHGITKPNKTIILGMLTALIGYYCISYFLTGISILNNIDPIFKSDSTLGTAYLLVCLAHTFIFAFGIFFIVAKYIVTSRNVKNNLTLAAFISGLCSFILYLVAFILFINKNLYDGEHWYILFSELSAIILPLVFICDATLAESVTN